MPPSPGCALPWCTAAPMMKARPPAMPRPWASRVDEFPQLWNVLRGDMSLIGPRAEWDRLVEDYEQQIPCYHFRHLVKPGITGWAQVNGYRGETDTLEKMQKRVEHDLWYIDNWSLGLDIKIIFQTIFKGFSGRNAY